MRRLATTNRESRPATITTNRFEQPRSYTRSNDNDFLTLTVNLRDVPADGPAMSFAGLLRHLRYEARLTQEELAEKSNLSPRSISDLERGVNRTARKDTAVLLADALGMSDPVRTAFVAAARGRAPASEVLAARERSSPESANLMSSASDAEPLTSHGIKIAQLIAAMMAAAADNGDEMAEIYVVGRIAGTQSTTRMLSQTS